MEAKSKGVRIMGNQEDNTLPEDQEMERVYAVDSRPALSGKLSHSHELSQSEKFFALTPKERQDALGAHICKTCFKPGGMCMTRGTMICSTTVPKLMICPGCTAFTHGKKISAHNILFCDSKHPTL